MAYFKDKPIKQLLIINPDNPSGNLLSKAELMSLLEWSKSKEIKLVVDESFLDFAQSGNSISLLDEDLLNLNPH